MIDKSGCFLSNKAFLLPSADPGLLSVLNSPLGWWFGYRFFLHMKDEALSNDGDRMSDFPLSLTLLSLSELTQITEKLSMLTDVGRETKSALYDWLRIEFGLDDPGKYLQNPERLDADAFAASLRKTLPRHRTLSAADIARLKLEHADII